MRKYLERHMFWAVVILAIFPGGLTHAETSSTWTVGTPIVGYYPGPALTDASAKQLVEGGWNLAWCFTEQELDIAQRHGMRALYRFPQLFVEGQTSAAALDDPSQRAKLDALVARLSNHPALYCYELDDEPSAAKFAALGRIVAYLREHDPKHLAFINLHPTYAGNVNLGVQGDTVAAYQEYLRRYLDIVKPSLLSYDHYQFRVAGDTGHYFLNLAMVSQAARQARIPFINVVQSCAWDPVIRVPNGNEMRFLVYTTLAYGAHGISYWTYCRPPNRGGIALADGTPTPLYHVLKSANREFVAIATEYQPLQSLGVYLAGTRALGTNPLPADAPFQLDPPIASVPYENWKPAKGILLGYFGPAEKSGSPSKPTHVLVVNLDYKADTVTTLVGPGNLEVFDATTRTWSSATSNRAELRLPPGGGKLVRQAMTKDKSSVMDIVKSGQPAAIIVIPDKSLPVVTAAAEELQYHVLKATGAKLNVVKESAATDQGAKIFLGATRDAAKVGLGVKFSTPNAFQIKLIGQSLFILGDDSDGPAFGVLNGNRTHVGTLFGVYEFIQKQLNARWLWPGELGEVVPPKSDIAVEKYDLSGQPPLIHARWRDYLEVAPEGWSSPEVQTKYLNDQSVWLRRHRFAMGVNLDITHAFAGWWDRFSKEHPEYFNLLPDGTRRSDPTYYGGDKSLISMSVGEPAFQRQIVADWLAMRSPQKPYIDAGENDTDGRCVCEKCLALDEPDPSVKAPFDQRVAVARERFATKEGKWTSALGSLSDRYARFYLAVQKEAEKFDPQAVVMGLAYDNYWKPPRNTKLNNRIIIALVPDLMYPWTKEKCDSLRAQWNGWAATGARLMARPNYTFDGHNLPIFVARKLGEEFSYEAAHGLIATDLGAIIGQWATQGPNLYILGRLHDDPRLSVDAVFDEYYSAFGKAAEAVRAYFMHWEKVSDAVPSNLEKEVDLHFAHFYRDSDRIFTSAVMATGRDLLEKAKTAARGDSTAAARVDFLDKGLTNAELTLAAQRAYRQYQKDHRIGEFAVALQKLDDFRASVERESVANMAYLRWAENYTWRREPVKLAAAPGVRLDDPWAFAWDPKNEGLGQAWFAEDYDVSKWLAADATRPWSEQEVGKTWKAKHGADYSGFAWYRKTFNIPKAVDSQRVRLLFGAVAHACVIWVNGKKVLDRPYPHQGDVKLREDAFEVDVTNAVRNDRPNTLAVRIENREAAGGICEPVWLSVSRAPLKPELNLIQNGGFEQGETGWLKNTVSGNFGYAIDKTASLDGQASASLICTTTADKEAKQGEGTRPWARWYRTDIPVEQGKPHSFRVWLKTSKDFAGEVEIFLLNDQKKGTATAAMLTTDGLWRELTIPDFVPSGNRAAVYLNVYNSAGAAWFDDVELSTQK